MNNVYVIRSEQEQHTSFGGSFAQSVSAADLGATTAREALNRANIAPTDIDHVHLWNVIQSSTNASYLARHIGLKADVPFEVPAYTVNRLCGSGAQAVVSLHNIFYLGEAQIVLAGGAENMSKSPFANFNARFGGIKYGTLVFDDMLQCS